MKETNIYSSRVQNKSRGDTLCLLRSKDYTGHNAYYFLKLDPLKIPQFEKVVDSCESFDLECYGEVIASGYGDVVPENVLVRMRRDYGWNA